MSGDRRRVPDVDLEIFEKHNDLVVAVDDGFVITYANPIATKLLGYEIGEIEGHNIADFVHPDDLLGAMESVGSLHQGDIGVAVTVSVFRIKRSDGTWFSVEFNGTSRIDRGPYAGWLVFIGRHPGDQNLHMRLTELLTSGADISDVIAMVPEFGLWRHPAQAYGVMFTGDDGEPHVVGSKPLVRLVERHRDSDTPWARAIATNSKVEVEWEELPPDLQTDAAEAGLGSVAAQAVPDPLNGGHGAVIGWSATGGPALAVHRYSMDQMARSLDLVMQWREHMNSLERAARYDSLTGLTNRSAFFAHLESSVFESDTDQLLAVLYVDLDEFKGVNDRLGHAAGDSVLTEASRRMSACIRENDMLARLGGDEFAVLCPGVHDTDEAVAVAKRLLAAFDEPIRVQGEDVRVGASIGIAVAPTSVLRSESLLERADEAMYRAKTSGRNRFAISPTVS
jgi:diguanylate cyclase (GGDEF)-like protein/PAS domain S-box-containing protein